MDSTLITIEACDELAKKKGIGAKISEITQKTMDGELDFDSAFPAKSELVAPSLADQERLGDKVISSVTPGFLELIEELFEAGHSVGILTQGYQIVAEMLARSIDEKIVPLVRGLEFEYTSQGDFHSFPGQVLKYEDGKSKVIKQLKIDYPDQKVFLVGDSVGDMEAGESADKFIAYGGNIIREKVRKEATYFVEDVVSLSKIIFSSLA